jgi:hypothetical protein
LVTFGYDCHGGGFAAGNDQSAAGGELLGGSYLDEIEGVRRGDESGGAAEELDVLGEGTLER